MNSFRSYISTFCSLDDIGWLLDISCVIYLIITGLCLHRFEPFRSLRRAEPHSNNYNRKALLDIDEADIAINSSLKIQAESPRS
jgi:hypothetical protein